MPLFELCAASLWHFVEVFVNRLKVPVARHRLARGLSPMPATPGICHGVPDQRQVVRHQRRLEAVLFLNFSS